MAQPETDFKKVLSQLLAVNKAQAEENPQMTLKEPEQSSLLVNALDQGDRQPAVQAEKANPAGRTENASANPLAYLEAASKDPYEKLQKMLALSDARIQPLLAEQKRGVETQQELAKIQASQPVGTDYSPLYGLIDSWTGSNLAKTAQKPQTGQERLDTISKLQQMAQTGREKLTQEQIQQLNSKLLTGSTIGQAMQTRQENKMLADFGKSLDPSQAGGVFGRNALSANAAKQILVLKQQFPDGNIPPAFTNELAIGVAGLLTKGSVTAQHTIEGLIPSSFRGDVAKIQSYIEGIPVGKEQQAFVKQLWETAEREGTLAHNNIRDIQLQRTAAALPVIGSMRSPEFWDIAGGYGINRQHLKDRKIPSAESPFDSKQTTTLTKPADIDQSDWNDASLEMKQGLVNRPKQVLVNRTKPNGG